MGGARRAVRRLAAAAAAACATLSVALPVLAQDEGPALPAIWRGAAVSSVATVEADREGLLPVPDIFRIGALLGESAYETDRQVARASLLFPGEGLIQGPNLACGTFGSAFPPELQPVLDACLSYEYPLTVRADASVPDASTEGLLRVGKPSDALSGIATGAIAHAAPDGARTEAALEDLRLLGLPAIDVIPLLPVQQLRLDPVVLSVGSATSRTDQRIDGGSLVVEATATLSDVRLVGGLVRIGGIRSTSRITDDAEGNRTADASLDVSGVTVGGLPAQITADGIVLGSPAPSDVLGPIQRQLQSVLRPLLDALGVRLTLLELEETTDDGTGQAVAGSGGLLLEVTLNADGLPSVPGPLGDIDLNGAYVGTVQLGATGASGAASMFGPDGAPVDGGGETALPDLGGGFVPGGDLPDLGDPAAPSAPVVPVPGSTGRAGFVTDLFDGRLELLYAAFALAVLALCLTPRLAVPPRLPGPRS
jgi:hypothetical protein